jgi:hypothetical protein
MTKRTCSLCDAPHYARGWCRRHYGRWREHGDPNHTRLTHEQRFWTKVQKSESCWLWQGPTRNGYGLFSWWTGEVQRSTGAHRYSYRLLRGEIPEGFVIDHLCRTPLCVNPDHLEPVTRGENVLRGIGTSARNRQKTHCVNDHEFTPQNTRVDENGHRNCRTCERDQARRRQQQHGPANLISPRSKARLREAVEQNPDASADQLASLLGWTAGYVRILKRAVYGGTPKAAPAVCAVEGCDCTSIARSYCVKHYQRLMKHGDPLFERPATPTRCSVEGCGREHRARGLCRSHWEKLRQKERTAE